MSAGNKVLHKTLHFNSYEPAIRFHLSQRLCKQGWQTVSHPGLASFTDANLSLNDHVSILLEYKHLCALLTQRFCPNISPETFALNDINYRQVIENLWYHKHAKKPWILKPSLLNNGDHIHLFKNMQAVVDYYTHHRWLQGDHVLQRYVTEPYLWEGRKFTFRIPAILTNDRGVFLHHKGYLNISALPYHQDIDGEERRTHITNYILDGRLAGIEQRCTSDFAAFDSVFPKMAKLAATLVKAVRAVYPEYLARGERAAFEIFGFDFILDKRKRPLLLEVNQGPDFPMIADHPLNQVLWDPFWQSVIDEFINPIIGQSFNGTSAFKQIITYHQATNPSAWQQRKGKAFLKRFENIIKIQ